MSEHAPFEAQLRTARLYQDVAETLLVATRRRPHSPAGDLWLDSVSGHVEPAHRLLPQARSEASFSPILQGFERFLAGCEEAQVRGRGWARVELPQPLPPPTHGARASVDAAARLYRWQRGTDGPLCTLSHAAAICRAEVLREELEAVPVGDGDPFGPALVREGYDQRQPEAERCDDGESSTADLLDPAGSIADSFAQPPAPLGLDEMLPTTPVAGPRALHGACVTSPATEGECA